ncbi:MAG: hypothetical protein AB4042_01315 [Leptolyngbyaceae cyanobacterium]
MQQRLRKYLLPIGLGLVAISIMLAIPQLSAQEHEITAPPKLLDQLEKHLNSTHALDAANFDVTKYQQLGQAAPLYWINTRSDELSPLCGVSSCAFFAYIPTGRNYRNVLSLYLNPHLPPDVPLVEQTEILQHKQPVLHIHQLEGHHLRQFTLAFNGQHYEITDSQLFAQRYD